MDAKHNPKNSMAKPTEGDRISLGSTDILVSPLGIGTWAWGDRLLWGYDQSGYGKHDIKEAFDASLDASINFFDTAETYGRGRSEDNLGQFVQEANQSVVIATKFMPYPWRLSRSSLQEALQNSLERMNLEQVGLYQIHWPFPPRSIQTWVEEIGKVQKDGLAQAVGVSNYNRDQMKRADAVLRSCGIPLASNQVEFSLINRKVEQNGLLAECRERNITLIAYSPLGMGLLTGKYTPENPPPGLRRLRYRGDRLHRIASLVTVLKDIGQSHGGKTPAQVALNWTICKGALPIPGTKTAKQVQENAGALGWRLTPGQIAELDHASENLG